MADRRPVQVLAPSRNGQIFAIVAWSVLVVLVAALLWLGLRSCSLAGLFPGAQFCRADTTISVSPAELENARLAELRATIDQLQMAIALAPACPSSTLGELNCPQNDPAELALVLDASLSMAECARLPERDSERLRAIYEEAYSADEAGNTARGLELRIQAQELERSVSCGPPDRRIDIALGAVQTFVGQSAAAERLTVTTLGTCTAPGMPQGEYGPGDRSGLVDRLGRLTLEENTPLAATITALIDRVAGGETAEESASVILISDGRDQCGQDPCAAARAFKAAKPHAVINVITVGGDPYVGLCIAEATGGNVFDGRIAEDLPRALRQASGQERPDGCR